MRVVFDSNVFISAFAKPGGRADEALLNVIEGRDHLIISKPIILETLRVLAEKFSHDREELARAAVFLADLGDLVVPKRRVAIFKDEPDNRILECALAGRAELMVTGDQRMLELGQYEGIRLISLREYLAGRR